MGRWYAALKKISETDFDETDKTDETLPDRVLSVLSVPDLSKSENFRDGCIGSVSFVSSTNERIENSSEHAHSFDRHVATSKTDADQYEDTLRQIGPCGYGPVAVFLGWGATRAANAEAELQEAGRITYDRTGRGRPAEGDGNRE